MLFYTFRHAVLDRIISSILPTSKQNNTIDDFLKKLIDFSPDTFPIYLFHNTKLRTAISYNTRRTYIKKTNCTSVTKKLNDADGLFQN